MPLVLRLLVAAVLGAMAPGCSRDAAPGPLESPAHEHYHLHAVDVEHDHEHPDFPAGAHTHGHAHDGEPVEE